MAVLYSFNLFIFILIGLIAIVYKFSSFDYDDFMSRQFEEQDFSISRKLMNGWDWDVNSKSKMFNTRN